MDSTETAAKLKDSLQNLKEEAANITDKANASLKQVKDRMNLYQEGAQEFLDAMSLYIKENPQRSALIAGITGVSLGVILGLLLRGGRR